MVPRREVFAVDIEDPDEEILDAVLESRHSRIPVYEENCGQYYRNSFMPKM